MIKHAVVLAIGNPVHHSQLTYNRPPAMLPALGKPLVARIMDRIRRATDIRHFIVVLGENEGEVASYLNDHWVPDVSIEFLLKFGRDTLRDVLTKIADKIDAPFLVTGYNSFTHPQFYTSLINEHNQSPEWLILGGAAHTLSRSERRYSAQYIAQNDNVIQRIDEQSQASENSVYLANVAACGKQFLQHLRETRIDPHEAESWMGIVKAYLRDHQAKVAETSWTLQTDSDEDLLTLHRHLLDEGQDAHILSELPASVRVIPPVRVDPQVSVGQNAQIGPYVYLERGSSIGANARVSNTILLQNGKVAANEQVENAIIASIGRIV